MFPLSDFGQVSQLMVDIARRERQWLDMPLSMRSAAG
jgi:hypothetical protein